MSKLHKKDEKVVQIGPKTWIVVKKNISDKEAIKRYYERQDEPAKRKVGRPKGGNKSKIEENE